MAAFNHRLDRHPLQGETQIRNKSFEAPIYKLRHSYWLTNHYCAILLTCCGNKGIFTLINRNNYNFPTSGFNDAGVITRIITRQRSRAQAIMDMADNENIGTIVIGRRGIHKLAVNRYTAALPIT
jgi:hypothetical protein